VETRRESNNIIYQQTSIALMTQFETAQLKSRRLAYFDATKGRTKTKVFTALEISQANSVFQRVEDILIENDYDIINKYVSISKCRCLKHDDTCFVIDVCSEDISMDVLREIEEEITGLQVKLIGVAASHQTKKPRNYLELVIIQNHHQSLDTTCRLEH
jgi:hypothetical protein